MNNTKKAVIILTEILIISVAVGIAGDSSMPEFLHYFSISIAVCFGLALMPTVVTFFPM